MVESISMFIRIMTKPGEGTLVLEGGQRRRGCSGNPSCSGLAEVGHHDSHDNDDDDDGDGETDCQPGNKQQQRSRCSV